LGEHSCPLHSYKLFLNKRYHKIIDEYSYNKIKKRWFMTDFILEPTYEIIPVQLEYGAEEFFWKLLLKRLPKL
jgi:hypothetical protein